MDTLVTQRRILRCMSMAPIYPGRSDEGRKFSSRVTLQQYEVKEVPTIVFLEEGGKAQWGCAWWISSRPINSLAVWQSLKKAAAKERRKPC